MLSRERALQIKILELETELRKKIEEQNQLVCKMSSVRISVTMYFMTNTLQLTFFRGGKPLVAQRVVNPTVSMRMCV